MQELATINNKELEIESADILKEAELAIVYDEVSMDMATILLKANDELIKKIDEAFDPIIKKAHEAHKEALGQKKKYNDIPLKIKRILRKKIGDYLNEERKKAEDEARKEQEKLKKQEEDRLLAEAEELENNGDKEAAQALLEKEIIVPQVKIEDIKKSDGLKTRRVWKYKIVDVNKIPREYMIPNTTLIGNVVRSNKNQTNIPGVEVYSETSAY